MMSLFPELPAPDPVAHVAMLFAIEDYNAVMLPVEGGTLRVHDPEKCAGRPCSVHNPSDHPLKDAPLNWRSGYLMERICEHGIGHPDPDHLGYLRSAGYEYLAEEQGVHGCDGCCGSSSPRDFVPVTNCICGCDDIGLEDDFF